MKDNRVAAKTIAGVAIVIEPCLDIRPSKPGVRDGAIEVVDQNFLGQ